MKYNWRLKEVDLVKIDEQVRLLDLDQDLLTILQGRGIETADDILAYLKPSLFNLESPFNLLGMDKAIQRIKTAISKKEKIAIFADSDLDGITSLVILFKFFEQIGIKIYYRYPQGDEDYGLKTDIIREFAKEKINLVITVDSGLKDVEEIKLAKSLGMEFIVTDHHEQGEILPEAIVVNPKQRGCFYSFKNLAGVGVTFRLTQALLYSFLPAYRFKFFLIIFYKNQFQLAYLSKGKVQKISKNISQIDLETFLEQEDEESYFIFYRLDALIPELQKKFPEQRIYTLENFLSTFLVYEGEEKNFFLKEVERREGLEFLAFSFLGLQLNNSPKIIKFIQSVLGLVALGTIADVMPLVQDNRILVFWGIKSLNRFNDHHLKKILPGEKIDANNISWKIAPFLNAPGRFGQTGYLLDFFLAKDEVSTNKIISKITQINEERKNLSEAIYQETISSLEGQKKIEEDNLIFIKSGDIPEGLCGLLANRLSDYYQKPVIVTSSPDERGFLKGSGRVQGSDFNWFNFLDPFKSMFEKIGGHPQAFGFKANLDKIDFIIEGLKKTLQPVKLKEKFYEIDLELDLEKINVNFIKKFSCLEPFGKENQEPIFLSRKIKPLSFSAIGQDNKHGSFKFKNNRLIQAIGWNLYDLMRKLYKENKNLDIIYTLENNHFKGKVYPRIIILDLSLS